MVSYWQRCQIRAHLTYLYNMYAEFLIGKTELDSEKGGVKTGGRNFGKLRYIDDTTLLTESSNYLKQLLRKLKEESAKAGLPLEPPDKNHDDRRNIQL